MRVEFNKATIYGKGCRQLNASQSSIDAVEKQVFQAKKIKVCVQCERNFTKVFNFIYYGDKIMKALKIIVCLTIVIAAVLYAAKTPTDFGGGLKGFLKTKAAAAAFTNDNGWIIFTGLDAKSQIQITEAASVVGIVVNDAKQIKQKGKIAGTIDNIVVGTDVLDAAGNVDLTKLAGNAKFSVKLKGVNVGTVLATDMKMVLVNGLNGTLAGNNAKGIKVMTQDGDLAGADAANRAVVGLATVPTMIKMVKAKKGKIEYVDATEATPAKVGKTKWMAKVAGTGDVLVKSKADWNAKSKNVIFNDGSATNSF